VINFPDHWQDNPCIIGNARCWADDNSAAGSACLMHVADSDPLGLCPQHRQEILGGGGS
jgi:hypothetical protein